MTPEFLARAIGVPIGPVVEAWAEPLTAAMAEFGISGSLLREACFLATINHESRSLSALRENMNYGAQGLANTWPRFSTTGVRGGPPNDLAFALARKPEKIANHVYANRMGNGIPESGDGWTYRGGGPGMLTGRDNYRHFGQIIGVDLENQPELIETPRVGALAFAAFWRERGCNEAADSGDFDKVSDLVNIGRHTEAFGDSIGWIDRAAKLRLALSAWEGPIE